ncbi:hypothetical protein [Saccharibacillus sacchari]|uniref:hypothetical protein n=1 Tax=Saccharibacillus sacchari TaxID=456493 RepID=UPI00056BE843|nr:hypothetical protein [Saccharibacillus sacchari]
MFALQVTAVFNITDRGYVLAGTLQDSTASIGIGNYVKNETEEIRVQVKGIEHLNYGSEYREHTSEFGILVNITKQEAENLIGKILFEE